MKIVFLVLTIVVAIFFLRGNYILPSETFALLSKLLLPLYLIMCGIMLGYIIAQIMIARGDETPVSRTYVKAFTIGIVLGIISALLYIFFGQ